MKGLVVKCLFSLAIGLLAKPTVAQPPVADFNAAQVSGCAPFVVNFSDLSTGGPQTWLWDFGNGNTSALQHPSTIYLNPGSYTVKLTVTNAAGNATLERTGYITVHTKPVVDFSAGPLTGCFPLYVNLQSTSTASPGNTLVSFIWDGGNGTIYNGVSPVAVYNTTGSFPVTLTVTDNMGCTNSIVRPGLVNVSPGVNAAFTSSTPLVCHLPAMVNFTNQSNGPAVLSYQWDFGDGFTSVLQHPTHSYTVAGYYSVRLITSSSQGCSDTVYSSQPVEIGVHGTIQYEDSVCVNEPGSFAYAAAHTPDSVRWYFGDGGTAATNPAAHSFSVAGTYTIRLYSYFNGCIDSILNTIEVLPLPVADFSADFTSFCTAPAQVHFQNLSFGGFTYNWDFGDGNTSSAVSPYHTYTAPGLYTVRLTVTSLYGCSSVVVKTDYIHISHPHIALTGQPWRGCIPFTVNFNPTVTPAAPVLFWQWDFGDGYTSSAPNPAHTYLVPGTYTVSLIAHFAGGCSDTLVLTDAVHTGTPPQLSFTANPRDACALTDITFTNTSVPSTIGFLWYFGDGGTSASYSPVYSYSDTGYFTVTLIGDNNGCRDTLRIQDYIHIKPPIAHFSDSVDCTDRDVVYFRDESIGALIWDWDFGDGHHSAIQHPSHQFTSPGTYHVKLTVTNDMCTNEYTKVVRVILQNPAVSADMFSHCKNDPFQFTVTGVDPATILRYNWTFGDATFGTGGPQVSHAYTASGTYNVSVTVTDLNGCTDMRSLLNPVEVRGPVADFSSANRIGCKGHTVLFDDQSTSDGTRALSSWTWDFGDAHSATLTSPPFTHTYSEGGYFSVSLTVADVSGCSDTKLLPEYVFISVPDVHFAADDTIICPDVTVHFTNSSTGGNLRYFWEFGDGGFSNLTSPAYTYHQAGLYTVKLRATDSLSCSESKIRNEYIRVTAPHADFTRSDTAGACTPFVVQFSSMSQYADSLNWHFGDGGTANTTAPTHSFIFPGVYPVRLIAYNTGGCSDTVFKNITVYDTTGMRLNNLSSGRCVPADYRFSINNTSDFEYSYDFGDGNVLITHANEVQHTFLVPGTYVPKAVAKDPAGCVFVLIGDTLQVHGVKADFSNQHTILCDSGRVSFIANATATEAITTYAWQFGDRSTGYGNPAVHLYNEPGIYAVTLHTQTISGCADSIQKPSLIRVAESPDAIITGPDQFCVNSTVSHLGMLNRLDRSGIMNWQWKLADLSAYQGQQPPAYRYRQAGDYQLLLIAINNYQCSDTVLKKIRVHPLPQIHLPAQYVINAGESLVLQPAYSSGIRRYQWIPTGDISCISCPSPVVSPRYTRIYEISVVDSNSCRASQQTEVIVRCNKSSIYIPTGFTPNNDGKNDVFMPTGTGYQLVKSMKIFNRWGELVYQQHNFSVDDKSKGWNGRVKGQEPFIDAYVYMIEIDCDGGAVMYKGTFALIK